MNLQVEAKNAYRSCQKLAFPVATLIINIKPPEARQWLGQSTFIPDMIHLKASSSVSSISKYQTVLRPS